jgi:uncharacterized protein YbjT (DUF2867 family)
MADDATQTDTVRLAPVLIQPMAADDVATAVARIAVGPPLNRTVEVAGPEQFRLDALIGRALRAHGDRRAVVPDSRARYYGVALDERTLLPNDASLADTGFEDWLARTAIAKP